MQGHLGEGGRAESLCTDGLHAGRDVDGGQLAHVVECLCADGGDGAGQGDAGHLALAVERIVADAGDGVGLVAVGHVVGHDDVPCVGGVGVAGCRHLHLVGQHVVHQAVVESAHIERAVQTCEGACAEIRVELALLHGHHLHHHVAHDGHRVLVVVDGAVGRGIAAVQRVVEGGVGEVAVIIVYVCFLRRRVPFHAGGTQIVIAVIVAIGLGRCNPSVTFGVDMHVLGMLQLDGAVVAFPVAVVEVDVVTAGVHQIVNLCFGESVDVGLLAGDGHHKVLVHGGHGGGHGVGALLEF